MTVLRPTHRKRPSSGGGPIPRNPLSFPKIVEIILPLVSRWNYCSWLVTKSCLNLLGPHRLQLYRLLCPRILQARILEWVAISFTMVSSWPRDRTHVSCLAGRFFTLSHLGSPSLWNYPAHKNHSLGEKKKKNNSLFLGLPFGWGTFNFFFLDVDHF